MLRFPCCFAQLFESLGYLWVSSKAAGFDVDGVREHVGSVIGSEIRVVLRKSGSDVAGERVLLVS